MGKGHRFSHPNQAHGCSSVVRTLFRICFLLGFTASCVPHFVMPGQLSVASPSPATPNAVPPRGPVQGYLRVRATTNLDGLAASWSDDSARTLFNKLLVSVRLNNGTLIPILDFDLTGANGAANTFSDIDVAKLMLVSLDHDKQAGDQENPNFSLVIDAVPFTMANVVDSLVQFATSALSMLPPGADVATAFGSSGTSQLISGVMGSIGKAAKQASNRVWTRVLTTSVESSLANARGVQTWILCPDDDNGDSDPTLDQPPKTCKSPPPLVYCAGDASTSGVLNHICTTKPGTTEPAHLYTDYAWVSLRFELLDTPGTDATPDIDCNKLRDKKTVDNWLLKHDSFRLKQIDQDQFNWFVPKLVSYNSIVANDGAAAAQIDAFQQWYAAVDATPTAERRSTWTDIYDRAHSLDTCLDQYVAANASARIRKIDARQIYDTMKTLDTLRKDDIQRIYDAIFTLGAAMVDLDAQGGDVSSIAKARTTLEKKLFFFLSDGLDTAKVACAVKKYPKCQFCQQQASGDCPVAPNVRLALGGDPTKPLQIEQSLTAGGFDPTPIVQLRQIDQRVGMLDNKAKAEDIASLVTKRQEAATKAADVLHKSLGLNTVDARDFLLGH